MSENELEKLVGLHSPVFVTESNIARMKDECYKVAMMKSVGIQEPNALEILAIQVLKANGYLKAGE
jgi:hypothetical protein